MRVSKNLLVVSEMGKGKTKQSFKDACDVNKIVARFMKGGVLPGQDVVPQYGDATLFPDFRGAQDLLVRGRQAFDSLPDRVKRRFHGDAASFMEFVSSPDNLAEGERLGLWKSRKVVPEGAAVPAEKPVGKPADLPAGSGGDAGKG